MTLHALCRLDELPLDEGRTFSADGRPVGVFRLHDGVYALHDICTHGMGRLTEGFVADGLVECPLHAGCFDIRTGRARTPPVTVDVAAYAVTIQDGTVYVELPETP